MTEPRLAVWPPLSPGANVARRGTNLPFPLQDPLCRLFSRARHGLWHGVRALGLTAGDRVLVPAYNHGSEVEALIRTGVECVFYDPGDSLEPEEAQLDQLLSKGVKALYLIHYLGFPQDSPRWRAWCDAHGLLLFEDAAQAWLSQRDGIPVGSSGDLSIYCLYKTFGLPDGAALLATSPPLVNRGPARDVGGLAKRHAAWLQARSRVLGRWRPGQNSDSYDPARDFELGVPDSVPSSTTLRLLPHVADPESSIRRRSNYRILLDQLSDLVLPPFTEIERGTSPFAFPIEVDDKEATLTRLREHNIIGLNLWSTAHPSVGAAGPFKSDKRRERTIGLPVHQELRPRDLERIVTAVRPARTQSRPRVEDAADLDAVRDDWARLAEASGNIFASWEWADIWCKHFLGHRPMSIKVVRSSEGSTDAILPLYLWVDSPFKIVRFLGHGPGDQLGPVCDPGTAPRVSLALTDALRRLEWKHDLFIGDYMSREEEWGALLGARSLRRFESPILRFDGNWDEFLHARSSNFREQVRRRERALQKAHDVSYRLADDPNRIDDDLETLFRLYDARWAQGERAFSARKDFHTEFALTALKRGWLRLWFMELAGQPVAAWYGFRFAGVEFYYQAGRDPEFADSSVGFVLLAHTIREALNDGIREYRLLRGGESYKYRFATVDPGIETVAIGSGRAAGAFLQTATRLGEWGPARKLVGRRLARLTRT